MRQNKLIGQGNKTISLHSAQFDQYKLTKIEFSTVLLEERLHIIMILTSKKQQKIPYCLKIDQSNIRVVKNQRDRVRLQRSKCKQIFRVR